MCWWTTSQASTSPSSPGSRCPSTHVAGDDLLSGAINGAGALTMRATASARDSQYQRILELVREAAESKAPVVRLADRIAVPFTLFSVALAARLFVVITRTPVSTWPKTDRSAAKATPGEVSFPLPGWGDVPGPLEPTGTRLGVR
ncbi:hypothetical protein [Salsipaludibacter albus]|uniref:P-type ATPase n=1 Tax=Salsipaludibacter albus TaxID=2849650 RepID=UPI003B75B6E6